jgi:hypothetical protein
MEYVFTVRLSRAEQVIDDSCEFVRRRCDGLRFAKFPGDTAKELSEVVFGVV